LASKPVKIYWDSCAWIGLINGEADKRRELEIVYSNARKGHYELWTSALAIGESHRFEGEVRANRPWSDENHETIKNLFRQPCVKVIPLAVDIAENAREIYRNTLGLGKWQDAIHVASAIRWNLPVMHTYDRADLLHLSMRFKCKGGENLAITYPDETTEGPLFARRG
jgi:predicted nucleic acid-binding protein